MLTTHRDLDVWKLSQQFIVKLYRATQKFPREEQYGLTSQLRRATVAIAANIAEGAARRSRREFLQFSYIARGSASEVACELLVARDLGMLSSADYEELTQECERISKMLTTLIKSLRAN